jgi:hypothetical protein
LKVLAAALGPSAAPGPDRGPRLVAGPAITRRGVSVAWSGDPVQALERSLTDAESEQAVVLIFNG